MSLPLVAVTGASGLVGSYVVAELVKRGFRVKAALRDAGKVPPQLAALPGVQFVAVPDITRDDGFAELVKDAAFVHHIASPVFVDHLTKDEQVQMAVDGTVRTLRFALASGSVSRVVLTASLASVCGSQRKANPNHLWTEQDVNDEPTSNYSASKVAAEQAAWDFVKAHPALELTTIHPSMVFGPLLPAQEPASSVKMLLQALDGTKKADGGLAFNAFGAIDARDVARAHVLAMISPEAKNQRYLVSNTDQHSMLEIVHSAIRLFPHLGATAALQWKDDQYYAFVPKKPSTNNAKIIAFLGSPLFTVDQALRDTVQNFIDRGFLKAK